MLTLGKKREKSGTKVRVSLHHGAQGEGLLPLTSDQDSEKNMGVRSLIYKLIELLVNYMNLLPKLVLSKTAKKKILKRDESVV